MFGCLRRPVPLPFYGKCEVKMLVILCLYIVSVIISLYWIVRADKKFGTRKPISAVVISLIPAANLFMALVSWAVVRDNS